MRRLLRPKRYIESAIGILIIAAIVLTIISWEYVLIILAALVGIVILYFIIKLIVKIIKKN